jgi:hypothetical protein
MRSVGEVEGYMRHLGMGLHQVGLRLKACGDMGDERVGCGKAVSVRFKVGLLCAMQLKVLPREEGTLPSLFNFLGIFFTTPNQTSRVNTLPRLHVE